MGSGHALYGKKEGKGVTVGVVVDVRAYLFSVIGDGGRKACMHAKEEMVRYESRTEAGSA